MCGSCGERKRWEVVKKGLSSGLRHKDRWLRSLCQAVTFNLMVENRIAVSGDELSERAFMISNMRASQSIASMKGGQTK